MTNPDRGEMIKALVQNTIDSFDARDYEYYVRNSETDHLNSLDNDELLLEYNERFQND